MSLNEEQKSRTREELRANFDLSGLSPEQAAKALGFTAEQFDDALCLAPASHPADVWLLRDYLEREVIARGIGPVPFTVLTPKTRLDAADWFNLRPARPI